MGSQSVVTIIGVEFLNSLGIFCRVLQVQQLVNNIFLDEHHNTSYRLGLYTKELVRYFCNHDWWVGNFIRAGVDDIFF